MPNRRTFYLVAMMIVLSFPAEQTVRQWGRRQLAVNSPGTIMHGVGEVLVTILP
jgi:hypothetical protein